MFRQAKPQLASILAVCGIALAAATVVALHSPTADAAVEARLEGDFTIIAKIIRDDRNPVDPDAPPVLSRTYTFKPLCPVGPCSTVQLWRPGPDGNSHGSDLHARRRPGVYGGVENTGFVGCGDGTIGTQAVRLRFRIKAEENGLATRLKGRAKFLIFCSGKRFIQDVRLTGTRPS